MNTEINLTQITFGSIPENRKEQAKELVSEYLPGDSGKFIEFYEKYPDLVIGCTDASGKIIGVCFGFPRNKESVLLQGIAIHWDYAGKGLGSRLIKLFEESARKNGYKKITLGSAEGYVEHFYLKNGYTPIEYMIKSDSDVDLSLLRDFEIKGKRKENGKTIVYITDKDGYKPEIKDKLKRLFRGSEVIYLFEKEL